MKLIKHLYEKNNLILAFFSFIASTFFSGLLFAGLFSAHWDYIVSHTSDTLFVLIAGTLIPITFVSGVILYFRGISRKEDHILLLTLGSIPFVIMSAVLGGEIFFSSVVKLYKIQFGIA